MEPIPVFILWIREKWNEKLHRRYGDPWDEMWYIHCISEDEEGIRLSREQVDKSKWETEVKSYPQNTLLYTRAING